MIMTSSSIDRAQPESVEEHFKLILDDKALIEPDFTNVTAKDLPVWFNEKLFKNGQNYYKSNIFGVSTADLTGLIAVLLVPSIAKVLSFTKNSSTPCSAFKRYFETTIHVTNIYTQDPKDSESKFYKSINTIRWKHSCSSRRFGKKKENEGIFQRDMVLTQFSAIGYVLTNPNKFGLTDDSDGQEGLVHVWRVVGHLLGIPERINLCRKNKAETTLLCKKILDNVYGKFLDEPNENFSNLTEASMSGLKCLDPLIDFDAFMVFLCELHDKKYKQQISWSSKLNVEYRKFNFKLIRTPGIGFFMRHFWNFYLRLSVWLNERCPIIAWIRFGKSNSKINLYPAVM